MYVGNAGVDEDLSHRRIGQGSLLVAAPDPVVCFARSRYQQHQRFLLATDSSLVATDVLTSGRCGCGERWAMDRYESRMELFIDDRCIFRDVLRLDPVNGPVGGTMRMGRWDCFASLLIAGEPMRATIAEILKFVAAQPAGGALLVGASPIETGGIVRVAGDSSEAVMLWLRQRLAFLVQPLGGDPWSRKW